MANKVKDKQEEPKVVEEKLELTQQERIDELSQEIFGKPAKDLKYVYVTNYIHQSLLEEELARTGLYQWINVFNGEVKYPRQIKNYNDYDIIQVNMSTQDIHMVGDIRQQLGKDSKTKIVLNNDFTTEIWASSFPNPSTIAREGMEADMIFGTEYYQATALAEVFGRQIFVIPHPADVKRLKSLQKIPTKNLITTIWRRYDNHYYIPSLVVRDFGLTTQLIGYDEKVNNKTWLTTSIFDWVFRGTNYFDFCDQMRESKVLYDPFTFHSYNRAIVDCAALGVPVVGSDRTQAINVCYPFTKVDPYDVAKARALIERILGDDAFRKKVVDYAEKAVEIYNHENSREKYLTALSQALDEGREPKFKTVQKCMEKGRGVDINHAKEMDRIKEHEGNKKFRKN